MGTVHYIGCRDCGVRRGLDNISSVLTIVQDRPQAMELSRRITIQPFRVGLLVSFLSDHQGHNCTLFSENEDELVGSLRDEGLNFWKDEIQCPECGLKSANSAFGRVFDESGNVERCCKCGRKIPGTEIPSEKPTNST